ncbi:uncharacterized protein [Nothobranchius furzeri]|uniref:uncharacterized protein isoform X1 n=1 Tax=Nothobranchius furzeri TaxID=105023 RepID=UPI003904C458
MMGDRATAKGFRWCSVELGRVVFGRDADVTWTPPVTTTSMDTGSQQPLNSVRSLLQYPFERRTMVEKLNVKELGPDQPDVKISQQEKERGKLYTLGFSRNWYTRKAWLSGCNQANALFCFPCLLFKTAGTDKAWIESGVTDMKHFSEKVKKHESSRAHMDNNTVKLAMLGRANIAMQLDEGNGGRLARENNSSWVQRGLRLS